MTSSEDDPLAYKNARFIESEKARPLRILPKSFPPLEASRREKFRDTVVFFGSARIPADGPLGRYYDEARELARLVTAWSKGLTSHVRRYIVCSGGGPGIM